VLFTLSLAGSAKYLPIVNWQFVIMQPDLDRDNTPSQLKKYVTPILACARESTIYFFQVDYFKASTNESGAANSNANASASAKAANDLDYKFKFLLLKKSQFKFKVNFCFHV
jgi:hypothetical protein